MSGADDMQEPKPYEPMIAKKPFDEEKYYREKRLREFEEMRLARQKWKEENPDEEDYDGGKKYKKKSKKKSKKSKKSKKRTRKYKKSRKLRRA